MIVPEATLYGVMAGVLGGGLVVVLCSLFFNLSVGPLTLSFGMEAK